MDWTTPQSPTLRTKFNHGARYCLIGQVTKNDTLCTSPDFRGGVFVRCPEPGRLRDMSWTTHRSLGDLVDSSPFSASMLLQHCHNVIVAVRNGLCELVVEEARARRVVGGGSVAFGPPRRDRLLFFDRAFQSTFLFLNPLDSRPQHITLPALLRSGLSCCVELPFCFEEGNHSLGHLRWRHVVVVKIREIVVAHARPAHHASPIHTLSICSLWNKNGRLEDQRF